MTPEKTYELVGMIYALFGRTCPARTSPVVQAVTQNTQQLPDTLVGYVYERFKALDSLPQNLTKAILGAWDTWLLENPRAVHREECQACGGMGGFDCWQQDGDGRWRHFFAFCPSCAVRKEKHLYLTPGQWKSRGVLVMPVDFPGGPLEFQYQQGILDRPEKLFDPKSIRDMHRRMNRRMGYDRAYGFEEPF